MNWKEEAKYTDMSLKEAVGNVNSLSPEKECATPIFEIGLKIEALDPNLVQSVVGALCLVTLAELKYFPQTLFWDKDYLASVFFNLKDPKEISKKASQFVSLFERFSSKEIKFRYSHDFTYGFDWARWVQKEPERFIVGPFDEIFLLRMQKRGQDILQKIASKRDKKFPLLKPGDYRNPFKFDRSKNIEFKIFKLLAAQGDIPLPAWDAACVPTWQKPYDEIREKIGLAL